MSDPDEKKKKRRRDGDDRVEEREPPPPEDPVDEASWESFPASDPPAFTPEKST